jgi:sensor histidine kinase YesM
LRYRVEVDPDVASLGIPPMLVQPVVENAIRHGLEPKVEGGEVGVRARRDAGGLLVQVSDSGVGFAPATRGGVGLSNLRERLRALYGEHGRMEIIDRPGGGTCVELRIPA